MFFVFWFVCQQLLAALAQTVLIVMDRFAYLYRSIGLKALLHFVSAIFIHVAVFFVLPLQLGVCAQFVYSRPFFSPCLFFVFASTVLQGPWCFRMC